MHFPSIDTFDQSICSNDVRGVGGGNLIEVRNDGERVVDEVARIAC